MLFVVSASYAAEPEQQSDPITIGQTFTIRSEVLGEDRKYSVYLPASYKATRYAPRSYPVLYLLDGGPLFHSATGVVQYMSSNINGNTQIPELIVIAVSNTNRQRDLTPSHTLLDADGKEQVRFVTSGGGDRFLRFFREELIPEVESKYRTARHRTLVGNSLGGLLALHAMIHSPDLFQAYIANDPSLWWDDALLVRQAKKVFSADWQHVQSVFISSARSDDERIRNRIAELDELFSADTGAQTRFKYQHFDAEDHGSLYLPGLYHGLKSVFLGYNISFDDVYFGDTGLLLTSHFERLSARLGIALLPPEFLVDNWGRYALHGLKNPEKALEFFKTNESNFPESANVFVSLADAYIQMHETLLAIENLERALEADPNHIRREWTRKSLARLREAVISVE
ncbi:MAG TPA: alpha/beta hydrolase-fold protein [Woeseiaceae bacterium]|nr:alpha/beta hydrolase-fold protein [Woeseiaceae bacterium]